MSSTAMIQVEKLGKAFQLYAHPADLLFELLGWHKRHREFWALKDVSFAVSPGEVLGIIGRNGAGKSTLLRILAGTLDHSEGSVKAEGRISAMLELGSGFHPDYTGRENILMGGMCLGMTRSEVEQKTDSIIEFSELGEFIDQPFRTYSSGMKARLTFATAISIVPSILIVDEVLAVGDARFSRNCFDYFHSLKQQQKTIVLVSHDMNTVNAFCDRAILLEKGQILAMGEPREVTHRYFELLFGPDSASAVSTPVGTADDQRETPKVAEKGVHLLPTWLPPGTPRPGTREGWIAAARETCGLKDRVPTDREFRVGGGEVEILDVGLRDADGTRLPSLNSGQECILYFRALICQDLPKVSAGILIRSARGVDLFGVTNETVGWDILDLKEGCLVECRARVNMWLTNGTYFLTVGISRAPGPQCELLYDALTFDVAPTPGIFATSLVDLNAEYHVTVSNP